MQPVGVMIFASPGHGRRIP